MPKCCVPWCTVETGKKLSKSMKETGIKISLHTLPRDPMLLKEFCSKIGREIGPDFQISRHTTICSLHYKADDFYVYASGKRQLKPNALPSVFDCGPRKRPAVLEENALPRIVNVFGAVGNMDLGANDTEEGNETTNSEDMADEAQAVLGETVRVMEAETRALRKTSREAEADDDSDTESGLEEAEPGIKITKVESPAQGPNQQLDYQVNLLNATNICLEEELAREKERSREYETQCVKLSTDLQMAQADLQLAKVKIARYETELAVLKSKLGSAQASLQLAKKEGKRVNGNAEAAKASLQELKDDKELMEERKKKQNLEEELAALKEDHAQLRADLQVAREEAQKLPTGKLSFEAIKDDSKLVNLYTGMECEETYNALFKYLDAGENGENMVLWPGRAEPEGSPFRHDLLGNLSGKTQLLIVFCRLRLNLCEQDLAHRFGVSQPTISRIVKSWIQLLYFRLGCLQIWPSKDYIVRTMPDCIKAKYPSTRVIIDAVELKCELPSSSMPKTELDSFYKPTNTFKGLIGITPNGLATFVSALFSAPITDKKLTALSGLLSQDFTVGDSVMADRRFDIERILPNGVSHEVLPWRGTDRQFSLAEIEDTEGIASLRLHVERHITRMKTFRILSDVVPMSYAPLLNQIWTVCVLLTNFLTPLKRQECTDPMEMSAFVEEPESLFILEDEMEFTGDSDEEAEDDAYTSDEENFGGPRIRSSRDA